MVDSMVERSYTRGPHDMRPLSIQYGVYPHADGSVLISLGDTRVLVGVTLQQGVPSFLRGKGTGWLHAEYGLMPLATHQRTLRESTAASRSGRSVEISRMIGRSFRSAVELNLLGERTITIDCDVLQADGSTRVAAINGVTLALHTAQSLWLARGVIKQPVIKHLIAAVSLGILPSSNNTICSCIVDLDYREDSLVDADFTFIVTPDHVIEVQGGAERCPVPWHMYLSLCDLARRCSADIFASFTTSLPPVCGADKQLENKSISL